MCKSLFRGFPNRKVLLCGFTYSHLDYATSLSFPLLANG